MEQNFKDETTKGKTRKKQKTENKSKSATLLKCTSVTRDQRCRDVLSFIRTFDIQCIDFGINKTYMAILVPRWFAVLIGEAYIFLIPVEC